jgi:hypothetical protein
LIHLFDPLGSFTLEPLLKCAEKNRAPLTSVIGHINFCLATAKANGGVPLVGAPARWRFPSSRDHSVELSLAMALHRLYLVLHCILYLRPLLESSYDF